MENRMDTAMAGKKLKAFLQEHSRQQHLSPTEASRALMKRLEKDKRQKEKDAKKKDRA